MNNLLSKNLSKFKLIYVRSDGSSSFIPLDNEEKQKYTIEMNSKNRYILVKGELIQNDGKHLFIEYLSKDDYKNSNPVKFYQNEIYEGKHKATNKAVYKKEVFKIVFKKGDFPREEKVMQKFGYYTGKLKTGKFIECGKSEINYQFIKI